MAEDLVELRIISMNLISVSVSAPLAPFEETSERANFCPADVEDGLPAPTSTLKRQKGAKKGGCLTRIDTIRTSPGPGAVPARHSLRSVGAVLGGLLATFVVTTAVDVALHTLGVFPPMGETMSDLLFVLALAYRIPLNIGGSYLAARLAPSRPMRHALALGVVGVLLATIGAITMGEFGPAWYSLANIAVALPCAWTGGRLRTARV